MEYSLKLGDPATLPTACLVLGIFSRRKLTDSAAAVDKASGGYLSSILKKGDMMVTVARH